MKELYLQYMWKLAQFICYLFAPLPNQIINQTRFNFNFSDLGRFVIPLNKESADHLVENAKIVNPKQELQHIAYFGKIE